MTINIKGHFLRQKTVKIIGCKSSIGLRKIQCFFIHRKTVFYIALYFMTKRHQKNLIFFLNDGYLISSKAVASTLEFITGDSQIHIYTSDLSVGLHIPVHTLKRGHNMMSGSCFIIIEEERGWLEYKLNKIIMSF